MTKKAVLVYVVTAFVCILVAGTVGYAQGFLSGLDVPKHVKELRTELEQSRAETQAAKEDLQHAMERVDKVLKVIDTALDVVKKVESAVGK